MREKFLLQVKASLADYRSWKVSQKGDYITYDGVDVSQLTELKNVPSRACHTYINKTVETLRLFLF